MNSLTQQEIFDLFQDIESRLKVDSKGVLEYLKNLHPATGEISNAEWRYRLSGYLEGISMTGYIDASFIEQLIAKLFARDTPNRGARPGRTNAYSIDILTSHNKTLVFDVPSTNPLDAYAQLTKRSTYKSIPNIESIRVFRGFENQRAMNEIPIRVFTKNELISNV